MEAPEEFLIQIRQYITLIEGFRDYTPYELLRRCLHLLPSIYAQAANLLNVEPDPGERKYEVPTRPLFDQLQKHLGKYDAYRNFIDPHEDEEYCVQSLADDLVDIYWDLKRGLLAYEDGRRGDAVWHWRFQHRMHFGQHIVWAMHALHLLVYNEMDRDYVGELEAGSELSPD